jgi:hypothetical protein
VNKFFQTLARLASSSEVSLAKSENNLGLREDEMGKTLARLGFYFYLPSEA